MLKTTEDALAVLERAWPLIVDECRAVLGGELHYQAVVYHCLRVTGVPRTQIGMNVRQWITEPISPLFKRLDLRKAEAYRGGYEPIPDVVLFRPEIASDWRRRNASVSLLHMLLAIEVKASERAGSRLSAREIVQDIRKLAAHREEVRHREADLHPVMMVIDTAPLAAERMNEAALTTSREAAREREVSFFYVAPESELIEVRPQI